MDIIDRLEKVKSIVQSDFGQMTDKQLNWKPSNETWSIAECLNHLVKSNSTYFPAFENIIKDNPPSFWEKFNPMSRSIGKNMIKSLGATVTRKHKSPQLFRPTQATSAKKTIQSFFEHQNELIHKFKQLQLKNSLDRNITSPVSPLITLPLADCLEVLTSHEERHLNQAKALAALESFPSN